MSKFIVIEATATVSYSPYNRQPDTDLVVTRVSFWENGETVDTFADRATANIRLAEAIALEREARRAEGCEEVRNDYDEPNVLRFTLERGWVRSDVMKIWTIEKI